MMKIANWAKITASILMIVLVSSCTDKEIRTALYGSSYTDTKEREQEDRDRDKRLVEVNQYCTRLFKNPQLSNLDGLLEMTETPAGRFLVMGVNRVPTDAEKISILKWAESKIQCAEKYVTTGFLRSTNRTDDIMYFAAELHNKNITYAEFARKRYEINNYYDEINRAEAEKRRAIALQLLGGMLLKNMNRPSPTPPLSVLEIIQKNQLPKPPAQTFTNCFTQSIGKGQFTSNCVSRSN